jgi:bacteriocin-like protein
MQQQQHTNPLNKGSIEITEDELKQVIGGLKLPGMHKAPDVTLKRGQMACILA